jgi:predicted negative regulator of RcsB-dependent stress response
LIAFAVIGLNNLGRAFLARQVKTIAVFMTVLLLFIVVEYLPVQGTDDMTAYYNSYAEIINAVGREEEAIRYWEMSSRMDKLYSAYANHSLAKKYLEKSNFGQAVSYLVKIPDNSPAAGNKHELMGDISLKQGDTIEAIAHYKRSLIVNSGSRETRAKLVNLLEKVDHDGALREFRALQYIESFYKDALLPSRPEPE